MSRTRYRISNRKKALKDPECLPTLRYRFQEFKFSVPLVLFPYAIHVPKMSVTRAADSGFGSR